MPGWAAPWRLSEETKQAIVRGLDYFEETRQASWTKLQRGFVEAATTAMNTSTLLTGHGAPYQPLASEDVGEAVGAGEAFSPEALEREENLDPVTGFATDVVAGIPTMMMGGAGEVADVAIAQAEAERSGMSPLGQAATTLLAGAPLIGARTAGKIVREIGGGTAKQAQDEFAQVMTEAATARPGAMSMPEGAIPTPVDFGESAPPSLLDVQNRTIPAGAYPTIPEKIESVKQNQESLAWYDKIMRQFDERSSSSKDAERFMQGLEDYEPTP